MPKNIGVIPSLKADLSNIHPLIRNYDKTIQLISTPYNASNNFKDLRHNMERDLKMKMCLLNN